MSCYDNSQREVARKIEDSLVPPSFIISPLSFFLSRARPAAWHLARLYQKLRLQCVIPSPGKISHFWFFSTFTEVFFLENWLALSAFSVVIKRWSHLPAGAVTFSGGS